MSPSPGRGPGRKQLPSFPGVNPEAGMGQHEQSGSLPFLDSTSLPCLALERWPQGNADVTSLFVTPERPPEVSPGQRDFLANLG